MSSVSPIDPEMAAILASVAAENAGQPDLMTLPPPEGRRFFERNAERWNRALPPEVETTDLVLSDDGWSRPARLMIPPGHDGAVILYLHGGGWTFGSPETHDRATRVLAQTSGAAVLSLDYRLAPEHPFPAGVEDAQGAITWIERAGAGYRLDPARLALAGDSAGANIALGTLIRRRDRGLRLLAGAALLYGCFASNTDTPSHRRYGGGAYQLTTARMDWFWRNYLGDKAAARDPVAEPLYADFHGLPPLYLLAAELDPLFDDTMVLSGRMRAAGVAHDVKVYPGVIHGFMQMTLELAAARQAWADVGQALKARLARLG